MEVQTQSLFLRQAAGFGEGCQLDPQGKVVPEPMQLVKRQLRCSGNTREDVVEGGLVRAGLT